MAPISHTASHARARPSARSGRRRRAAARFRAADRSTARHRPTEVYGLVGCRDDVRSRRVGQRTRAYRTTPATYPISAARYRAAALSSTAGSSTSAEGRSRSGRVGVNGVVPYTETACSSRGLPSRSPLARRRTRRVNAALRTHITPGCHRRPGGVRSRERDTRASLRLRRRHPRVS